MGVGLTAMLLTTNQVKALNNHITGYLPLVAVDQAHDAVSVFQANTEVRYDTAIGAHQGGADGGGALW
jgi:hypothetical protein